MNSLKAKIVAVGGVLAGVMAVAGSALADGFGTSTAVTATQQLYTDVGTIIAAVVGGILTLLAALMGLGWGVKKFRHYITGKKF